jgi:hypothetical protein
MISWIHNIFTYCKVQFSGMLLSPIVQLRQSNTMFTRA